AEHLKGLSGPLGHELPRPARLAPAAQTAGESAAGARLVRRAAAMRREPGDRHRPVSPVAPRGRVAPAATPRTLWAPGDCYGPCAIRPGRRGIGRPAPSSVPTKRRRHAADHGLLCPSVWEVAAPFEQVRAQLALGDAAARERTRRRTHHAYNALPAGTLP